jgi:MFS family permease
MAPELSNAGIITLAALWGALAFPIYPLAAAHANDRAEAGMFVMVSAGLLLMYGIGAIIGPFIAATMMTLGSPGFLFLFASAVHLFLAVYVVARRFIRPQPALSDHRPFSDALASTQTSSQIFEDELERAEEPG